VLARAGLDFDFHLATKHYAVHYLYAELGLSARVIAETWDARGSTGRSGPTWRR
jgi:hypothetical protein